MTRISSRRFWLALSLLLVAMGLWLSRAGGLSAPYDFLTRPEALPAPSDRAVMVLRLSTHLVPLLPKEEDTLRQVLKAGYRRLLIYYSMPTPDREKFVDCSPLQQGMPPAEFFRLKLAPLGIGTDRYSLVLIREPYATEEPFRSLAPAVAGESAASISFVVQPLEQRRFALLAKRSFGIPVHSFNSESLRGRGADWWRSHSGLESVAGAYLDLLWASWP